MAKTDNIAYIAGVIRKYGRQTRGGAYTMDMGNIPYKAGNQCLRIDKFILNCDTVYIKYAKGVNGKAETVRLSKFDGIENMVGMFKFYSKE